MSFFFDDNASAGDLDLDLFLAASVSFGVCGLDSVFCLPGTLGVTTFEPVGTGDFTGVFTGDFICFAVFFMFFGLGVEFFFETFVAGFTFFSTGEEGSTLFLFCATCQKNNSLKSNDNFFSYKKE